MQYWLLKSEPHTWSWQDQKEVGTTFWDGVRNYQANNYMKKMTKSDLAFFYHSGQERAIVGLVKISKSYYADTSDPRFGMVNVTYLKDFPHPISLSQIKTTPSLHHLPLIRQSRLSVMPIDNEAWSLICAMGGL